VRKKLNVFHKLMILTFFVQLIGFSVGVDSSVSWRTYPVDSLRVFLSNLWSAFRFHFLEIMFFVLMLFFIIGCILARTRKETRTVGYWTLMLIMLVNAIFTVKTIAIVAFPFALIAFGLTRRWWEVRDRGSRVRFRELDIYHKLFVVLFALMIVSPVVLALGIPAFDHPLFAILYLLIPLALPGLFVAGCMRAKRLGRTATLEAGFVAFSFLICALITLVLAASCGYIFLAAAVLVPLTRRLWEARPAAADPP